MPLDAIRIGIKILKKLQYSKQDMHDIYVVTQDPFETGLVGFVLARLFKTSLCVQLHTDSESREFIKVSVLNRFRRFLARFILPRADSIRVVSERLRLSVEGLYGIPKEKIVVLPIFSDKRVSKSTIVHSTLQERLAPFEKKVLMVSRLEKEKDVETGIKAFRVVLKKFPSAGLIIVGSGRQLGRLKLLTQKLGIQKNVLFEGWQSYISSYFKEADVYLLTSRYEGYGLTLIEAASAGCPIVTTDVGVVGDILHNQEHVLACPVGDVDCLTEKLSSLLNDAQKAILLSGSAKDAVDRVSQMSLKEYAEAFISVISH